MATSSDGVIEREIQLHESGKLARFAGTVAPRLKPAVTRRLEIQKAYRFVSVLGAANKKKDFVVNESNKHQNSKILSFFQSNAYDEAK